MRISDWSSDVCSSDLLALAARIYVPLGTEPRNRCRMDRPSPARAPSASEQREALLGEPWPFPGRPPKHALSTWRVTDARPYPVPVTLAVGAVCDSRLGYLFDAVVSSTL